MSAKSTGEILKEITDQLDRMHHRADDVYRALVESLKLQTHYARLLNEYDGGERVTYVGVEDWINKVKHGSIDSTDR